MSFESEFISAFLADHYGLSVQSLHALNGYDEQNYRVLTAQGPTFLLKIARPQHDLGLLQAQVAVTQHLSKGRFKNKASQHLPNRSGGFLTPIETEAGVFHARVLSWLEGRFWVDTPKASMERLGALGTFLGELDAEMADFFHPSAYRYSAWDLANAPHLGDQTACIPDPEKRRLAAYFLLQFETEVLPCLPQLPKAVIHNDLNDWNLLISGERVTGVIDFGDMVYSHRIFNLAIAMAYALPPQTDLVAASVAIVEAYHAVCPLSSQETDLLYWMIAMRAAFSATQSALRAAEGSTNPHHFVSEAEMWALLHRWLALNPLRLQDAFRKACRFAPLIRPNSHAALRQARQKHICPNLSLSYQEPLKIVRGALQYLYDDQGRAFIDCVNNVSHVGHCHPRVVRAMQRQLATLNTNTRYLHETIVEYAQALTATLPDPLSVCYFVNSGSEANDLAIRIARQVTGTEDVIVLDHAYHGTSTVAMELSPYKFDQEGGFGQRKYVHKALNPDLYRGVFRYGEAQAGEAYARSIQGLIQELKSKKKRPAAFICETLLGVGGQIPLPPDYLKHAYQHVRAAGGLCIADEVQVGFGRVGTAFWGFELGGVVPDIVVLGKPIGNGHPLAAVVVTAEIAQKFNNGLEYFNTFGGNPVSCVAGLSVLQVIQDEQLQAHAEKVGQVLLDGLKELMHTYSIIGDVRGHGLFVGAEFVKSRETQAPAPKALNMVVEAMKAHGFLLSTDGPYHNVLKIKPPMVFSVQNAHDLISNLSRVLNYLFS